MKTRNNSINVLWTILLVLLIVSTQNLVLGGTHSQITSTESDKSGLKKTSAKEDINLLFPVNADSISSGELPYFAWECDSAISSSVAAYNLKIVEINAGQSLSFAIKNNKPVFECDSIKESYYQYPVTADSFRTGSSYGWVVQAVDKSGSPVGTNDGSSAPAMLRKGGTVIIHDTVNTELTLFNPLPGSTIYRGQLPYFAWGRKSSPADSILGYKLKIVEIQNGQSPEDAFKTNKLFFEKDTIKATYYQFPAEADSFITGNNYAWQVQALIKNSASPSDSLYSSSPGSLRKGGTVILYDTLNTGYAIADFNLLSPADSAIVAYNTLPKFNWLFNNNSPLSAQNYKLTIVEILDGQTPDDALRTNKPIFEKDTLSTTHLDYPGNAASFKAGDRYAWMIRIYKKDGTTVWNDPVKNAFTFQMSSPTGVAKSDEALPADFSLSQNFPNPFNPSTTIQYEIPKTAFVKIIVYDILGKEIAVLKNEVQNSGTYKINFNAQNLASGIYFYKLTSGNINIAKKMILLK